jgi:hypothetical protein
MATPHNPGEVTTHSALKAYEKVLAYVGASLVRDTVDKRIIHDVSTGTATYMTGGNGSVNGIIDTQSAVGGWPDLQSLQAPADTDADGMPDAWEDEQGLLKNDPSDAKLKTVDGKYPNVETYINSLVASITENQFKDAISTSISPDKKTGNPIEIYLNGNSGLLKINHQSEIRLVQVYSITGQLLGSRSFSANNVEMQFQNKINGIFIVRIHDGKGFVYSQKVPGF